MTSISDAALLTAGGEGNARSAADRASRRDDGGLGLPTGELMALGGEYATLFTLQAQGYEPTDSQGSPDIPNFPDSREGRSPRTTTP